MFVPYNRMYTDDEKKKNGQVQMYFKNRIVLKFTIPEYESKVAPISSFNAITDVRGPTMKVVPVSTMATVFELVSVEPTMILV